MIISFSPRTFSKRFEPQPGWQNDPAVTREGQSLQTIFTLMQRGPLRRETVHHCDQAPLISRNRQKHCVGLTTHFSYKYFVRSHVDDSFTSRTCAVKWQVLALKTLYRLPGIRNIPPPPLRSNPPQRDLTLLALLVLKFPFF